MRPWLLALSVGVAFARKHHDEHKHKHAHTYLQICASSSFSYGHACVHRVSAEWPAPATFDAPVCKEAAAPYAAVGTNAAACAPPLTNVNMYEPITMPMRLTNPPGDYNRGADVDTFTDWDRIRCKDGQLFNTGWYKKYTPQECARLCAKIHNFYGKDCTHFSRQWIHSRLAEHDDGYGRDGDTISNPIGSDGKPETTGGPGSAGTGTGSYLFRGQCIFFNSPNHDCCSTKKSWELPASASSYCQDKYGDRQDASNSKHRSWRRGTQAFSPSAAWPVTSLGPGRRLGPVQGTPTRPANASGEEPHLHELFFPDGSTRWVDERGGAEEDGDPTGDPTAHVAAGETAAQPQFPGSLAAALQAWVPRALQQLVR